LERSTFPTPAAHRPAPLPHPLLPDSAAMRAPRALWAALALAAALAAAARAQAPAAPAERQVPTFIAPGFSQPAPAPEEAARQEVAGLAPPEARAFVTEAGGGVPRALLPPGLPARLAASLANEDPLLS
jgi:hypothetical protein